MKREEVKRLLSVHQNKLADLYMQSYDRVVVYLTDKDVKVLDPSKVIIFERNEEASEEVDSPQLKRPHRHWWKFN